MQQLRELIAVAVLAFDGRLTRVGNWVVMWNSWSSILVFAAAVARGPVLELPGSSRVGHRLGGDPSAAALRHVGALAVWQCGPTRNGLDVRTTAA